MSVYLSYLDKPKHAQQMISSAGFMAKNKITINNPVQTHFTVQGVQSYAAEQIKALKQREQRLMQGKEGIYAPLKVVLLSDQLVEFDENVKLKDKNQNVSKKQKARPETAKKEKVKTNARNAVSSNNQTIVKLEKQVAKRNSLQKKLQKMSQKYKEYFKDVDLKQGLKANKNKIEENQNQQAQQELQMQNHSSKVQSKSKIQEVEQDQSIQESMNQSNEKYDKTTYNRTKKINKNKKELSQEQEVQRQSLSQSNMDEDLDQSRNLSVRTEKDPVKDCTSYSQKLGTAIFQLFK